MANFYCEDGVSPELAKALGIRGHGATAARSVGKSSAFDEDHLWYATQHGLILITHNIEDFLMLHRAWVQWQVSQPHPGILLINQMPRGGAARTAEEIHQFV